MCVHQNLSIYFLTYFLNKCCSARWRMTSCCETTLPTEVVFNYWLIIYIKKKNSLEPLKISLCYLNNYICHHYFLYKCMSHVEIIDGWIIYILIHSFKSIPNGVKTKQNNNNNSICNKLYYLVCIVHTYITYIHKPKKVFNWICGLVHNSTSSLVT